MKCSDLPTRREGSASIHAFLVTILDVNAPQLIYDKLPLNGTFHKCNLNTSLQNVKSKEKEMILDSI